MGSEPEQVLRLVVRARRRLRLAAVAEALAGPAAGFLLVAAAVLAVARATGRADLPGGLLAAAALSAAVLAGARLGTLLPGTVEAALHLDRTLKAGERFVTVLETAGREPGLAAWAARGALARAPGEALSGALAIRPPGALLPLLLAGTLVAGLALLPASSPVRAAVTDRPAAGASPAAAAARPASAREALEALRARAEEARSPDAIAALDRAREALARGDERSAREAMDEAAKALGIAAAPAVPVPGATGGGTAAAGDPSPAGPVFRPMPVPIRAREAVQRYFGTGE